MHIVLRSWLWWSGRMPHGPTGKRLVLNSWFLLSSDDNANLAVWKPWCDADASSSWKVEPKSKIESECGGAGTS